MSHKCHKTKRRQPAPKKKKKRKKKRRAGLSSWDYVCSADRIFHISCFSDYLIWEEKRIPAVSGRDPFESDEIMRCSLCAFSGTGE